MSVSAATPSVQPVGWLRGTTAGLALFVASQVGFGLALSFVDSEPSGVPAVGAIVAAAVMAIADVGSIAEAGMTLFGSAGSSRHRPSAFRR